MKLLVSLGLIAYVSALHESHCNNFIQVKRSRNKRSPQWGFNIDTTTGGTAGTSATSAAATTNAPTTASNAATTTAAAATTTQQQSSAASTTATQAPDVTTTQEERVTTTVDFITDEPVEGQGTDYLILLDATGSMQKLTGPQRGREFVIGRFNRFLKTIRTQVERGNIEDGKIVVATFNKEAHWTEYNSIRNVADLAKRDYNPGYGTNLYDTIGCALQKFRQESSAAQKLVYILTDGNHQVKRSTYVAHTVDEVAEMVNEYRGEDGMQFSFLALINPEEKENLKASAKQMGIRGAEIRTTDFDGNNFSGLLRSVLGSMRKGGKAPKQKLPTCKSLKQKCRKGRAGWSCRRAVKNAKEGKRCT